MVALIILIVLILAAPYVGQLFSKDTTINTKDFNTALSVLEKAKKSQAGDFPVRQPNLTEKPLQNYYRTKYNRS